MEDLSKVQQDLINDLVKEFRKINPKKSNSSNRFTIDTIHNCLKEEERFISSVKKHNESMATLFVEHFKNEVSDFEKEFGELIEVNFGGFDNRGNQSTFHDLKSFIERGNKNDFSNSTQVAVVLISKTKSARSSDDYKGKGMKNSSLFVRFKTEFVKTILDSGKEVSLRKVIGLKYTLNGSYSGDTHYYSSLDELIQTDKSLQQRIVSLTT